MHNDDLRNKFIELRAHGTSVPSISQTLGVPASTLYDWNNQCRAEIHNLKLLMLEHVEERVLGHHQVQVESLASYLKIVDHQVALRLAEGVQFLGLADLIRMASSLRTQLYKLQAHVGYHQHPVKPVAKDPTEKP